MYEIDPLHIVHVGSPLDMAAKKGHLKIFKLIQSYWWINANSIISRWRFKTEIFQANNYLILTLTLIRWKWIKVHKKCLLFSLLNKTVSLWKIIYQCNIFLSSCTVFLYFPNRKKWYYCSCKIKKRFKSQFFVIFWKKTKKHNYLAQIRSTQNLLKYHAD